MDHQFAAAAHDDRLPGHGDQRRDAGGDPVHDHDDRRRVPEQLVVDAHAGKDRATRRVDEQDDRRRADGLELGGERGVGDPPGPDLVAQVDFDRLVMHRSLSSARPSLRAGRPRRTSPAGPLPRLPVLGRRPAASSGARQSPPSTAAERRRARRPARSRSAGAQRPVRSAATLPRLERGPAAAQGCRLAVLVGGIAMRPRSARRRRGRGRPCSGQVLSAASTATGRRQGRHALRRGGGASSTRAAARSRRWAADGASRRCGEVRDRAAADHGDRVHAPTASCQHRGPDGRTAAQRGGPRIGRVKRSISASGGDVHPGGGQAMSQLAGGADIGGVLSSRGASPGPGDAAGSGGAPPHDRRRFDGAAFDAETTRRETPKVRESRNFVPGGTLERRQWPNLRAATLKNARGLHS